MGDNVRWIKHYNSSQKILLVGEGDFSFSACLARAFESANNIVATSLDSEDALRTKHWTSGAHIEYLKCKGSLVLHGVDVNHMNKEQQIMDKKFDVIVFNFPHAGHFLHLFEQDDELIEMHREILDAFFKNAREMLSEGGEVHVTHRDDYPYNKWWILRLAKKSGLFLKEKVKFLKEDYPGYHNKRGGGIKSNKQYRLNQCFTFKFSIKEGNSADNQMPSDHSSHADDHGIIDGIIDALKL